MPSSFLDVCRFYPTTGGTTDWTYSSAVVGYDSPTLAGAINGAVYSFRAESSDLAQWEVTTGAYNSGTGVFARTTVLFNSSGTGTGAGQSGAGTKINFTTAPQVGIVGLGEDLLAFNAAMSLTTAQKNQAQSNLYIGPTRQPFTSGSGTYTVPTGCLWIEVFMVGGGGGGGGVTATSAVTVAGSDGVKTSFGAIDAAPGKGAGASPGVISTSPGGAGGTGGAGSATDRMPGSPGASACNTNVAVTGPSAGGGSSVLFGGGATPLPFATAVGNAGAANTGGGGSGAVNNATNNNFGAGGGAGESVYVLITAPGVSYSYSIGTGGAGGSSTTNGGAGGSGFLKVIEHYGS